jgi:hypothetical protein
MATPPPTGPLAQHIFEHLWQFRPRFDIFDCAAAEAYDKKV